MKDWWYKMSLTEKQIYDLNNMNVSAQKAQLGNILSTGGQADWNQSDENAPDYIKNRPFYSETVTIEWDGNTEGKIAISFQGTTWCHISDKVFSKEDLIGGTIETSNGNSRVIGSEDIYDTEEFISIESFIIVKMDNTEINGVIFPKSGIYFLHYNGIYTASLSFGKTIKLPERYLPDYLVEINRDYTFSQVADLVRRGKIPYLQLGQDYIYARLYLSGSELNLISGFDPRLYFSSFPIYRVGDGQKAEDITASFYTVNLRKDSGWSDVSSHSITETNVQNKEIYIRSTGNGILFKITVDDSGTISATKYVE